MQLQKELRTHNPPKDSTHVYYSHTKYELQTPTGSGWTRIHVFFSVFSTIFRWFIKETLSKRLCESVNFEQKITEKHTPIFFGPSGRIDSVFQFCPPESMKFKHAQCWGHPPRANMRTWRRLGAIFSRKMSPNQGFWHIPYWDQSYEAIYWETPVRGGSES